MGIPGSRQILFALALTAGLAGERALAVAPPEPRGRGNPAADFDRDVAPLIAQRCLECHSGVRPKGGLDLSRPADALKGGDSGPALAADRPLESLLWQRVEGDDMPPKHPLPAAEKAMFRRWLEEGARWGTAPIDRFRYTAETRAGRDWWSLQPVNRPTPPEVRDTAWNRNPIDRFVLARLEARGLKPSREADRHTLARRLSFDLLGLPPEDGQVEALVRNDDPSAYERMVDRLLASPHYGERWARHWLDVVRYGESDGFERNGPRRTSWPYRDWVIQALNADLSYREFCRLQLAGDVLNPSSPGAAAAVGFLVAGIHNTVVAQNDLAQKIARQDEIEDMVGSVGQTFLGLTVNCGRCHDHKFDPVDQRDYYRLSSALSGVQHGERDLGPVGRSRTLKVYTCQSHQPPVTRLLIRGQVTEPGEVVRPGAIEGVSAAGLDGEFGLPADAPEGERRRRLADWISHPENPLFSRVIVNRLWHYHFGVGLVETPNDLGFNGGRPSHPELLDWLAAELVAQGFHLKAIHRLIVTSATYQQASAPRGDCLAADAENRLIWRKRPIRLEGEALRDTMLDVAGLLNTEMGGPGFSDYRETSGNGTTYFDPIDPAGPQFHRRSIYRFTPRGANQGLLDSFDCPDPAAAAPRRNVTTTPIQALALWNDAFTLRIADAMAERVTAQVPGTDPGAVERRTVWVYRRMFQRDPRPRELALGRELVQAHGLAALCRALYNANEFVIVQ